MFYFTHPLTILFKAGVTTFVPCHNHVIGCVKIHSKVVCLAIFEFIYLITYNQKRVHNMYLIGTKPKKKREKFLNNYYCQTNSTSITHSYTYRSSTPTTPTV